MKRLSHKHADCKITFRTNNNYTMPSERSQTQQAMYTVGFWKARLRRKRRGKWLLGAEGYGERHTKAAEQLGVKASSLS